MLGAKTWQTARLHHRAAGVADLAGWRSGGLPAGAEPVRFAGYPGHSRRVSIRSRPGSGACSSFRPSRNSRRLPPCRCWCSTILLLRAQAMALGRRGYAVLGGKYGAPRSIRLGWLRRPGCGAGPVHPRHAALTCPTRRCSTRPSRVWPRASSGWRPSRCTIALHLLDAKSCSTRRRSNSASAASTKHRSAGLRVGPGPRSAASTPISIRRTKSSRRWSVI